MRALPPFCWPHSVQGTAQNGGDAVQVRCVEACPQLLLLPVMARDQRQQGANTALSASLCRCSCAVTRCVCFMYLPQDITRITHRDSVQDMVRKGRDLERLVLARAVRWHLSDRVLVTPTGRTVVFQD